MKREVYIIGGGAAGMVAAISAARKGATVTILEHKEKIGKKILATGNGKCNYTNLVQTIACYRSENIPFVKEVFSHFNEKDTVSFFKELGIYPKSKNGYLYPYSEQASSVVDVLNMEITNLGIRVICYCHVQAIKIENQKFKIETSIQKVEQTKSSAKKKGKPVVVDTFKKVFEADRVIMATGGKASEKLGSDGSGYPLLKSLGHRIIPVVPALVQLTAKGTYFESIAGVRMDACVSVYVNEEFKGADTGELQLTSYGISGIPVFQISRYAAKGLQEKKNVKVLLDLFPEASKEELCKLLKDRALHAPYKKLDEIFIGLINQKVATMIVQQYKGLKNTATLDLLQMLEGVASLIKSFPVEITGTNGFEQAQVCAGGIDTRQVDSATLESKLIPGLYITGELLDVDGICGGYNLQWAWSTGIVAGNSSMD